MKRVLIIEDEEVERTAIKKMLGMAGYEVEDACDGEEGIEKNRQNPADAAIVDIFLPKKSGLDFIREAKKEFPELKIIAISAMGVREELDIVSISKQYGAEQAFEKPFRVKEILDALKEMLGE